MYVISLKKVLVRFLILLGALGVGMTVTYQWKENQKMETMSIPYSEVIVVDAGHGLPDGGASSNGVIEAEINLMIAKKLEVALQEKGYDVIMTRETDSNIADNDKQASVSQMKASDLNNRVKIMNESGADFAISIHMNQFQNTKYWGWQTFFNAHSEEGKRLAENIQEEIGKVIPKDNKRTALKIEGIKIVDKTTIPVVIVECGFLSNLEEAQLLQTEAYQQQLVEGICKGVERFYANENAIR